MAREEFSQKLSNYEKETIINYSEADKTASLFTYNKTLQGQLLKLYLSYPRQVDITADNGSGGLTFQLPKKWVKIKPPRVLSQAQKEALDSINQRKRKGKEAD